MRISPCFASRMILVNPCFIQIKHNGGQWINEWIRCGPFSPLHCHFQWCIVLQWVSLPQVVDILCCTLTAGSQYPACLQKNVFSSDNVWIVNLTELVCSTTDTCYFNSAISTFNVAVENTVINENCCTFMMAISQSPWSPYPTTPILCHFNGARHKHAAYSHDFQFRDNSSQPFERPILCWKSRPPS